MPQRLPQSPSILRRAALAGLMAGSTTTFWSAVDSSAALADTASMSLESPANASLKIRSAHQPWQSDDPIPLNQTLRLIRPEADPDKATVAIPASTVSQPTTVDAGSVQLRRVPSSASELSASDKPSVNEVRPQLKSIATPRATSPAIASAGPIVTAPAEPPKFNPPTGALSPLSPAKTVSTPGIIASRQGIASPIEMNPQDASRIARVPAAPVERVPAAPVARVPAARVPAARVPAARVPVARVPVGRVPVGRVPVGQAPANSPMARHSTPAMDLNEGWVAREAINNVAPLVDPTPAGTLNAGTLNIRALTRPSAPAPIQIVAPKATPARESKSAPLSKPAPADRPALTVPPKSPSSSASSSSSGMTLAPPHATVTQELEPEPPPAVSAPSSRSSRASSESRTADEPIRVRSLKIDRDGGVAGDENQDEATKVARRTTRPLSDTNRGTQHDDRSDDHTIADVPSLDPDVELDFTGKPTQVQTIQRNVAVLRNPIRQVLQYFYNRPEEADGRSNWGMMHAIMVYGTDTKVQVGRQRHSTLAWIAGNNVCRGQRLLVDGPDGIEAANGVGLQGHQGQFLMTLALAGVPENYPLYANGKKYSVTDLIRREAETCRSGSELTFTLIGMSHYISTTESWTTEDGEQWDFERLIAEELSQPIVGVACGGTHRLMGLAHALRNRRLEGLPVDGQWLRAENFLNDFVDYTYRMQNRDGSFSTNWFEGREDRDDVDRKIQTTGHMVEWLLTYTADDELQSPRLVAAIRFLASSLRQDLGHDWSIGPKGHALRSLRLYHDRVFNEGPAWQSPTASPTQHNMAARHSSRSRR